MHDRLLGYIAYRPTLFLNSPIASASSLGISITLVLSASVIFISTIKLKWGGLSVMEVLRNFGAIKSLRPGPTDDLNRIKDWGDKVSFHCNHPSRGKIKAFLH